MIFRWFSLLLLALGLAQHERPALTPAGPPAVLADGDSIAASLVSVDPKGTITLAEEDAEEDQERTIQPSQLVTWGAFAKPSRFPQIIFNDGSLIPGDIAELNSENLVLITDSLGIVKVPANQVRGVLFQPSADPHRQDLLAFRIEDAEGTSDRLVLVNDDELSGTLVRYDENTVSFETEVGQVSIDLEKVAAIIFNPALVKSRPAEGMLVGLNDGAFLAVDKLVCSAKSLTLVRPGGLELKGESAAAVVALQPLGQGVVYLSDLKALNYKHVPFLSIAWPYKNDRNVCGSRLRSGGQFFCKGVGMHTAARLTYKLDKPYRRFAAEVALDNTAQNGGSAIFRVFVKRDGKWTQAAATDTVRGGEPPVALSVDLEGAKGITLLVDFADRGDVLDHANWLNARLLPL